MIAASEWATYFFYNDNKQNDDCNYEITPDRIIEPDLVEEIIHASIKLSSEIIESFQHLAYRKL